MSKIIDTTVDGIGHVTDAPEGIIRLRIVGDTWAIDSDVRKLAKGVAAKLAHSLVGAPMNVRTVMRGDAPVTLVDYAPIARGTRKPAETAAPATGGDDRLAYLERELARVTALLTAKGGKRAKVATPAPVAKVAKLNTFVADVIAPRAAARAAASCQTCRDFGVVRGVGERKGQAYRTQAGADAATAAGRSAKCKHSAKRSA